MTQHEHHIRIGILHAAEMYLWDGNEGDDDGPHGKARVLKVTHNNKAQVSSEAR